MADGASIESLEELGPDADATVRRWVQAIDRASTEEADWRKEAQTVTELYRASKEKGKTRPSWNILASNVNTLRPALYNSPPIPDIRRRFRERDPVAQQAGHVLERCLTVAMDNGDWDTQVSDCVQDLALTGRGVCRVKYEAEVGDDEEIGEQSVSIELVPWSRFRRGPARLWKHVPWVAYEHQITRDEAIRLFGKKIGTELPLTCYDADSGGSNETKEGPSADLPDIFRRARVWEIWDKESRKIIFVSPAYQDGPLKVSDDPFGYEGFFDTPKPIYSSRESSSLVPMTDYRLYRDLAVELDTLTRRIGTLIKVIRWRGGYSGAADAIMRMSQADDGELVSFEGFPIDQDLAKAIWLWPIEQAVAVLTQLYVAREQCKQAIYEVSGVADIMRGATDAKETLGAQRLKAQWGTQKLQERQKDVQRYCRDILRLMSECICTHYTPETLQAISGIQVTPEIMQLLRSDELMYWRIDIETDSTVRSDVGHAQEQISNFMGGLGQFLGAVGPAVQAGMVPKETAVKMVGSFARVFRLGRNVELELDRLEEQADQAAKNPEAQAQKPDPEMQKMQMQAAAEKARFEQIEKPKLDADLQLKQAEIEGKRIDQMDKILSSPNLMSMFQMMEQQTQTMALAAQAIAQAAQAMQQTMQLIAAPTEIVRDQTGRAIGTRKAMPQQQAAPMPPMGRMQ